MKHNVKKCTKRGVAICMLLTVSLVWANVLFAQSKKSLDYYQNDECIRTVFDATYAGVSDVNKDGRLDCIDYSITFKREWDKRYNPRNCELIYNRNVPAKWYHLFVRCRESFGSQWLYVETQAQKHNYKMETFWDETYNPLYNRYHETKRWMKLAVH